MRYLYCEYHFDLKKGLTSGKICNVLKSKTSDVGPVPKGYNKHQYNSSGFWGNRAMYIVGIDRYWIDLDNYLLSDLPVLYVMNKYFITNQLKSYRRYKKLMKINA